MSTADEVVSGTLDVLLLEDTPTEAALVERIVRGSGSAASGDAVVDVGEWHHADTLEGAIAVLDRASVDVIVSDLMVPDSRGADTIAALNRQAPLVPIIALTSHDGNRIGTQTIQAGAQDYLVKGRIDAETVGRSIRYAIERKRHELELLETNRRLALLGRIIGHDLQREMSVSMGWAGELTDDGGADRASTDRDVAESLIHSLEIVVELADAAADVVSLIESTSEEDLEARSIDAILETEVDRYTAAHPSVAFTLDSLDSDVPVLATPMLGSVFEHLFSEAIQVHGAEEPRPRITIGVEDTVSVTIRGEGVSLTDDQVAFLNDHETPSESARRTGTGLYLAATVLDHVGGSIHVDRDSRIVVSLERPPDSDE
ncbi:response regulator [Halobacteria archaeon AArc-dxtr1]|nr:response regulator [Halobacteria archaeon AArc-dxtr1]